MKTSVDRKLPLTTEQLKASNLPLIIFGAGPVGEILSQVCRKMKMEVAGFCDNSAKKAGTVVNGLPVMDAATIVQRFNDAVFIIAVADIKEVVNQLCCLGYDKWTDCSMLKHVDLADFPLCISPDAAEFVVNACLLCHENYLISEKLFIHSVDIIITDRCSLRCRDCSNLMQYYKHPRDYDVDHVITGIDALCRHVDEVNEFRIIGGEPLMHPQLHLIARRLISEHKVRRVVIDTNATLLPRPEHMDDLKDKKVLFMITDYGELSRNLTKLIALLDENGVACYVRKAQGWANCSKIMRHGRTPEELQRVLNDCCVKNLITLSGGRLFRCPFMANALRLQAIPDDPSDYLDFFLAAANGIEIAEMKIKLRSFLTEAKYFNGCDYCAGRFFDDPEIPPAIQIKQPLDYFQYKEPKVQAMKTPAGGMVSKLP